MLEQITTAEELDALPGGSLVVVFADTGGILAAMIRIRSGEWFAVGMKAPMASADLVGWLPATVLWRSDRPTEPARVLPSRERVRSAIQIRMSAQLNYRPDLEGAVDDVLALFANAPTVEQVKAEALIEAVQATADDIWADGSKPRWGWKPRRNPYHPPQPTPDLPKGLG